LICNLIKTTHPPIFHWAQAAPIRYKDRSHWTWGCSPIKTTWQKERQRDAEKQTDRQTI